MSNRIPLLYPGCKCRERQGFAISEGVLRALMVVGYQSTGEVGVFYCKRCRSRVPVLFTEIAGVARSTASI